MICEFMMNNLIDDMLIFSYMLINVYYDLWMNVICALDIEIATHARIA